MHRLIALGGGYAWINCGGRWVNNKKKIEKKTLNCPPRDIDAWIDYGGMWVNNKKK